MASLACHELCAQSENRFRNFHGLKQNGSLYYEGEGYNIFIKTENFEMDEKGIKKFKRKYNIKNGLFEYDSSLTTPNKVLVNKVQNDELTAYYTYYLLSISDKNIVIIGFTRPSVKDVDLEKEFVNTYLSNTIPSFIYTPTIIDSIDFVGRTIELGPACHWMSPHNIQCPDMGQMNWSIFDDLKSAEDYRDVHYNITKSKNLASVLKEEWIVVKFENQEVKALRTKVKIQLPKLIMGGSNVMIVYYVTTQLRGKFVTCILSHYSDDVSENELPPLLSEVMELK